MPELPEVEFARRCWQRWARRRTVTAISVLEPRVVKPDAPRSLEALRGATFVRFERRGKNLLLSAQRRKVPVGLWSHLGMSGKWLRREASEAAPRFSRVRLDLDDGHALHYVDMRLFGKLRVVPSADFETVPAVKGLGPDALVDGVDPARLGERLARLKGPVKVALLDQRLLAGVGNIQASEALYRAKIDPRRPARSLDPAELRRLATAIRRSIEATLAGMEKELRRRGDVSYVEEPGSPNPFLMYARTGERCRRCRRGVIRRIVQAARSTFFCPACQA